MSEKYKIDGPDGLYFATSNVVHWIDLFTRLDYKDMIVESLQYCQDNKGMTVHAWCIMSSHIHMVVSSSGKEPLSGALRDFKKFASKKAIELITGGKESRREWLLRAFQKEAGKIKRNSRYKVWQDGNHPVLLDTNTMIDQRLDYIHENPVVAGIVEEPQHYLFSSARDYFGVKGLLSIDPIE